MRSLFSSNTLSFLMNCSATSRRSSLLLLSKTCVRSCGIFRFTIFFSTEISSAKFRRVVRQTRMSLLCRASWILYFFSSLASNFLSSLVAWSPSSWKRMCRRSMSCLRTWWRSLSYSNTRMTAVPHWCCIMTSWNCEKCEKQRKQLTSAIESSKLFFEFSRNSRLITPSMVSCSAMISKAAGSMQTRRMHLAPWTLSSMRSS
mmetsp:Transcript_94439/g.243916  ORF Transcript_94439/g.243916 Transcript_94439/m.243916 type:complete len:202 (-) Transcript_94439:565-1170(-)